MTINFKYAKQNKDYGFTLPQNLPEYTPLWCVYGSSSYPQLLACMVAKGNIWGYSVYKNAPGYRTMGKEVKNWAKENGALFFTDQDKALDYLKDITSPKKSALEKLIPKRLEIEDRKRRAEELKNQDWYY